MALFLLEKNCRLWYNYYMKFCLFVNFFDILILWNGEKNNEPFDLSFGYLQMRGR